MFTYESQNKRQNKNGKEGSLGKEKHIKFSKIYWPNASSKMSL